MCWFSDEEPWETLAILFLELFFSLICENVSSHLITCSSSFSYTSWLSHHHHLVTKVYIIFCSPLKCLLLSYSSFLNVLLQEHETFASWNGQVFRRKSKEKKKPINVLHFFHSGFFVSYFSLCQSWDKCILMIVVALLLFLLVCWWWKYLHSSLQRGGLVFWFFLWDAALFQLIPTTLSKYKMIYYGTLFSHKSISLLWIKYFVHAIALVQMFFDDRSII